VTDPHTLLEDLAAPRLVGSAAHQRARAVLTAALEARGFAVQVHRFPASAARMRLAALGGAAVALLGIAAALRVLGGPRAGQLALWTAGLTATATLAAVAAAWARRPPTPEGRNLIATRSAARPRVWLVAHYDSKGQGLSMLGRLVAVALAGLGTMGLAAAGGLALLGADVARGWWLAAAAGAGIGGYGLLAAGLRNDSPGAVDNGTGVVAALAVAAALPAPFPLGVILTDAEELGLLGAAALARERAALFRDAAVVNLDGIDDRGATIAFMHRPGPVVAAVAAALAARRARWLPVLVDGVPLGRVSREAVTVLRGDAVTMAVVHRPADTVARIALTGVDAVAAGVATALRDAVAH